MPEMKDSGVDLIGYIPRHWSKTKIKYISSLKTGSTPKDKIGIDLQGDYMWITPSDINGSYIIDRSTQYISKKAIKENKYRLFPPRSVLLVCIASVGKVGITNEYSYSNQQITAIKPNNKIIPKYLLYSMVTSEEIMKHDASNNVVPIINSKYLDNFSIPFPSIKEQKMISDYLDSKCSEIDTLRADIEEQIRLLEEYKKSVITEAVTKGLDQNVEMKDSGVEWIGMIPSHWEKGRIKDFCRIARGGSPRPIDHYLADDNQIGYNWVRIGDTQKGCKFINHTHLRIVPSGLSSTRLIKKGSLLLTNSMSFGEPYILNIDGCIHDGWLAFYEYHNITKEYLYYVLMSENCRIQFILSSAGAVVSNLNIEKVANTTIFIPSIEKQLILTSFLDNKCSEIDDMISKKKDQLSLLEDYKKSLIYEYVTGKKEVPADFTGGES